MNVLDAINNRRAVRDYLPDPVEDGVVCELIAAAIQAPSAMNCQPWAFTVIQDKRLLHQLSEKAKEIAGHSGAGVEILRHPDFNIFYNAGTLIVFWAKQRGAHPEWDCFLAGENLMLRAREMGLGTCPIGFAWEVLNRPETKIELNVPEEYTAVLPVIVGHAKEFPPSHGRKEPEILSWKRATAPVGA